ncbi:MAG: DUF58 domain-containing protein [Anaerolineae bacterium]|nr:DUF58 domain-containing protein [Anaerolineae bacterium]
MNNHSEKIHHSLFIIPRVMLTKRAFILLIFALILYLLANQTQVGWVYLMSNLLLALLVVDFFYGRGILQGVRLERTVRDLNRTDLRDDALPETGDFFEDDAVEVTLQLEQTRLRPAFLIAGQEQCPFAPPADQIQPFFVPSLFRGRPVRLNYQTQCDRRGVHRFPELPLQSNGAFGLFRRRRTLPASESLLIYPQFHPLKRLRLLEHRGFTDRPSHRAGHGSEIIGTREYRSGDSLRHIHWRSTARVGSLVVKELSDQAQLTMTVVLDLSFEGNVGEGKFSTFETALRLAATFGYYAAHKTLPFRLIGHSPQWRPPTTALSWWGTLNYLAKVENDGREPLAEVLRSLPRLPFVIVLISRPDPLMNQALMQLNRQNTQILAVFITPDDSQPAVLPASSPSLTICTVSPHNWPTVVAAL